MLPRLDELIIAFDKGLRTVFGPAQSLRETPGEELLEGTLSEADRTLAASLMRVNHSGEICAQALYQGQSLTARSAQAKAALEQAAQEETEHLAWTESRIHELGGRKSLLIPAWYAGSFAIGAAAGLLGNRWNLGFLAETERQVVTHLEGHLDRLPKGDLRSRAVLTQMRQDEARHATSAIKHGGGELPAPAKLAMRLSSKVMTGIAYWI
ncbi:MAG: 2-polyprenyl-3-methyl-6-methoxy-1,4-benzoquinone monooxygenase [Betaproteobacteria bacterium]|nr:2-polyprenyl-3-methyl-6-methoxy-1,4-benzoquinone monooxygenase [Betaproteobacteria bacterium]MDH3436930.1 2-polyprenyl-3-methyl-6-methoxy-1,4-benzoquinone monooxygenase [Betaproteobacteria bacterium]